MDRTPPRFDVTVVGAGPAGSATALSLAKRGCCVALIERSHFEEPRIGESLAPSVMPLLADLGVWQEVQALRPIPSFGTRSIWGAAEPEAHSHLGTLSGSGWHVDRLAFDRALANEAQAAGADLLCGRTVDGCRTSSGGWVLEVREDDPGGHDRRRTEIRTAFVVDATGRSARLAAWVGARRFLLDRLIAVGVEFDSIDTDDQGYVMVETTADGWWYTAPVVRGRMMAMLMTDSDLCGRAHLADQWTWFDRLGRAEATRARLDGGLVARGPFVASAISHRLRRREMHAPWLAVGDAALAVDPISGSGVVRALRSAACGSQVILAMLQGGMPDALEGYEAAVDDDCTTYLQERRLYYAMEKRWRSPFWERRAVPATGTSTNHGVRLTDD